MTEEKQIEEMAKAICGLNTSDGCFCDGGYCNYNCLSYEKAEALYNVGYRKRSEVAREIIDEFLNAMQTKHKENSPVYGGALALLLPDIEQIAAELKKYTEGEKKCPDCKHFAGCETACGGVPCDLYDEGDEK